MTPDYIRAGVIGSPVGHSLSPLIHNYWIEKYGLQGKCEALDVPPGRLQRMLSAFIAEGYAGFNVTLPHKQDVMALCDQRDNAAEEIGAVNTLVVKEGRLHGANTDAAGFISGICEEAPEFDFSSGPSLVLGAGGAARAVIYGLKKAGAPEITVVNRTPEKAQALARDFGINAAPWADRESLGRDAALLVNATSSGMKGQPPLDFDISSLKRETLVCDIVYNPLQTKLLRDAAAHGNPVVGGLAMLLHQARPGFEFWFGVMPEVTGDLRNRLEKALS